MTRSDQIKYADEHPKSPWISVKDRLPEDGAEVITEIGILSRHFDKWYPVYAGDNGYYPVRQEIKYWMPKPKLPKED